MLGIIGAMPAEMNELFAKLENAREETIGLSRFSVGTLYGTPCVLGLCGIGKVHAGACAQAMILQYHPDMIFNIGVAGALLDDLKIGDVVVSRGDVQHDVDTTAIGDPLGLVSTVNVIEFPCDEQITALLMDTVQNLGIHACKAVIASGDQFICGEENKHRIAKLFDAGACDMESAAIAQICYEMHTPFAAYRAISDTVKDTGRDYHLNMKDAAEVSAQVTKAFLERWGASHE